MTAERAHRGRLAAAVVGALLAVAPDALAFRTAHDFAEFSDTERVRWETPVISYVRHPRLPQGLPAEAVSEAFLRAFSTWSEPPCSEVVFADRGTSSSVAGPDDGVNTIQWITSDWAGLGVTPDAAAVTDVQYEKGTDDVWRIVEADLYLNAEHHDFTLGATATAATRDLLSVATHEAGHMLGLAHPCEIDGEDDAPDCADLPGAVKTAMYPAYSARQSSLSRDDEAGVCFLYPAAKPPCHEGACEPCQDDADCSPSSRCVDAACVEPVGAIGDPCSRRGDCAEGACVEDQCRPACTRDADCSEGICEIAPTGAGCVDDRASLGERCSESAQCLGGQCLDGVGPEAVCTRLCGPESQACPVGWECLAVGERQVCAPTRKLVPVGGSCRAATAGVPRSDAWPVLFVALVLVSLTLRSGRSGQRGTPSSPRTRPHKARSLNSLRRLSS